MPVLQALGAAGMATSSSSLLQQPQRSHTKHALGELAALLTWLLPFNQHHRAVNHRSCLLCGLRCATSQQLCTGCLLAQLTRRTGACACHCRSGRWCRSRGPPVSSGGTCVRQNKEGLVGSAEPAPGAQPFVLQISWRRQCCILPVGI